MYNTAIGRLVAAVLISLLAVGYSVSGHAGTDSKPNIVLMFVDDLGWTDLGYRTGRWQTPNIDGLRNDSLEFIRAYAASPTCSPSRAALISGQHPARLRMVRHIPGGKKFGFDKFGRTDQPFHQLPTDPAQFPSRNWLPLEVTSMAEVMNSLGYYTAFGGKWHLGSEAYFPVQQGFDQEFGVSNAGHPGSYFPPYWEDWRNPYPDAPEGKNLTERLTDDAVGFIESYDRPEPFLLLVSYYTVHTPHVGPPELAKKYLERGFEEKYAHFGAMVESLDQSVGRILTVLEENRLSDNTVVVFFSDQGGYFTNEPLRGGKNGGKALYEGGARVPLLVRWPGHTRAGDEVDELVISTDILPTFIDMAGGDPSAIHPLDGRSIVPLIHGERIDREEIILYRHYEDLYAAVITREWKLIASLAGKHQLFRIGSDPYEEHDVAQQHPDLLKDLLARLGAWKKDVDVEPVLQVPLD